MLCYTLKMKEKKSPRNKIVEELQNGKKDKVMFYVDSEVQSKFKKFCVAKKIKMSSVIEKLITNFLNEGGKNE